MNNRVRDMFAVMAAAVVLALALVQSALCDEVEPPADAGERSIPAVQPSSGWNTRLSVGYLPAADLGGTNGSASVKDYRFRLAHDLKLDSGVILTLGGGYGLKHIDATTDVLDVLIDNQQHQQFKMLPKYLHSLYVETGAYYPIGKRDFVTLKLYPGLYSDFEAIDSNDVRMPVLLLAGHTFNNGATLVGGAAYRYGYHAAQLILVLGVSYQPSPHWRIDLVAPRPGLSYIASRKLRLYVAGDFASDEYELKDPALGAEAIRYRDYKVIGGAEYQLKPGIRLNGAAGYSFDRAFDFFGGKHPSLGIDDAPFLHLSLEAGW